MFDLKKGSQILTVEAWDIRNGDVFIYDGTPLKVKNVIQDLDNGGIVLQTIKLRTLYKRHRTLLLPKKNVIKVIR